MYSPGYAITVPPMVSIVTKGIGWMSEEWAAAQPASGAWESADRAVYQPIIIPATCVVRRVWWANGSDTVGGATIGCGVYADSAYGPGAKLISGSATQGTASQVQFVDVTDTTLAPGLYWLALMASSLTNTTVFRVSINSTYDAPARFEQNTANPLPATATPIETTSAGALYLFGFATTASP